MQKNLYFLIFGLFVGLGLPRIAWSTTIRVTTTVDSLASDGSCSLREAIRNANQDTQVDNSDCRAGSGDDFVAIPAGTYTLSLAGMYEGDSATGDLDITSNIILRGASLSTTIIDANGIDKVFDIQGSSISVTMAKMTITGGAECKGGGIYTEDTLELSNVSITENSVSFGCGGYGGGLYVGSNATATIENVIVSGNTANKGGGIYIDSVAQGVTIENSTISGNTANSGYGGGIATWSSLTLSNSTVSGNTADDNGGGVNIALSGASPSTTSVVFENSTISGNTGHYGAGVYVSTSEDYAVSVNLGMYNVTVASNTAEWYGGGLYYVVSDGSAAVLLANTLIGDNSAVHGGPDCYGTITTLSYSLIEDTSNCTVSSGTTLTGSPLLDSLANYGGKTQTHRLRRLSPAVDAGDPIGCKDANSNTLSTDQRGKTFTRPVDGNGDGTAVCDIGAVEHR